MKTYSDNDFQPPDFEPVGFCPCLLMFDDKVVKPAPRQDGAKERGM